MIKGLVNYIPEPRWRISHALVEGPTSPYKAVVLYLLRVWEQDVEWWPEALPGASHPKANKLTLEQAIALVKTWSTSDNQLSTLGWTASEKNRPYVIG
ncbi:hypothetical protein SISSUDRAFT_1068198 [Sistotremastrum suecicum HHB10207 ss-3]|uniref:Uncharacterized protein n=1 Tax=Sistotremastrum suecicum HHB10207 ss-3 TaxID=1314776 RepID=A0A165WDV2_9AGAM|nr:hypothetical protein SISSUDRAFT_1068198 [Sistotremastrum suecicum HHB10207 ss-3]